MPVRWMGDHDYDPSKRLPPMPAELATRIHAETLRAGCRPPVDGVAVAAGGGHRATAAEIAHAREAVAMTLRRVSTVRDDVGVNPIE